MTDRRKASFMADLRGSLGDLSIAVPVAAIAFAVLAARLNAGVDPAAHEMPDMVRTGGVWTYSASQAVGWAALLWSWLTIQLGLAVPIFRRLRRGHLRNRVEGLHRSMSLTLIALMLAHAVLLLGDKMGDTLVTDFVPWTTSYVPGRFPQALGIFSLYLALLLGLTFYVRGRIGPGVWRILHRYLVPAVYGLALWHTFAYGSDVKGGPFVTLLWAMQAPPIALYAWRLWLTRRSGDTPRSVSARSPRQAPS